MAQKRFAEGHAEAARERFVIHYEGVRFSDGSCAIRRIDPDPCERCTRTFESVRELNEELGRDEVITWLADMSAAPAYRQRVEIVINNPAPDCEGVERLLAVARELAERKGPPDEPA